MSTSCTGFHGTSAFSRIARAGLTALAALAISVQIGSQPLAPTAVTSSPPAGEESLQFTSGNHVMHFSPGSVILAGLDHALTIEFVEASHTQPQRLASDAAGNPSLVTYSGLWPGVDVRYSAIPGGLVESTYVLQAGAAAEAIKLRYNVPVAVQPDGGLRFTFETGYLIESAPVAWQEIEGRQVPVSVRFAQQNTSQVSFAVGAYDPHYSLVIDPRYTWHAFYGSATGYDSSIDAAVDAYGNIYVVGTSQSDWNGPGNKPALNPFAGNYDIVLVKLDPEGVYQWHTFYGSVTGEDWSNKVVVSAAGDIYIAAESGAAWNGPGTTPVQPLNPYAGAYDMLILKLNSSGAYQWHTFFGSVLSDDYAYGVALDAAGNVYGCGFSNADWNGPGGVLPLHAYAGARDTVILKLAASGAYQWHTFYGSVDYADAAWGIALDGAGNIYAAGYSIASWNGPGPTQPLNPYAGNRDIMVLKLSNSGAYQWHTFYGSTLGGDSAVIAADASGNLYLAGYSTETWNGPGARAPLHAYADGWDIVVLKLNSAGAYQWHTFYGSVNGDQSNGVALDPAGDVYIAAYAAGGFDGPGPTPPLNPYAGKNDMVVLKLNASGAYQWHSFYGGATTNESGYGIGVDRHSDPVLVGESQGAWDGPGATAPLNPYAGATDIAVVKMVSYPGVMGVYPSDGAQVCRRPRVGVDLALTDLLRTGGNFDPSKVVFYLDGTDVAASATILQSADYPATHASLIYTPTSDLPLGSNWAALIYPTAWGYFSRGWIFTVADILCAAASQLAPGFSIPWIIAPWNPPPLETPREPGILVPQ